MMYLFFSVLLYILDLSYSLPYVKDIIPDVYLETGEDFEIIVTSKTFENQNVSSIFLQLHTNEWVDYSFINPELKMQYDFIENDKVFFDGNIMYSMEEGNGFSIFDISDNICPNKLSTRTYYEDTNIRNFVVDLENGYAYISMDYWEGIEKVDISDLTNPIVTDTFFSCGCEVRSMIVKNELLYIATDESRLRIFNVSGSTVVELGDIEVSGSKDYMGVWGNYTYTLSYTMEVFNTSDPTNIDLVFEMDVDWPRGGVFQFSDGLLYASFGCEGVIIYNISNPSNIFQIGQVERKCTFPENDINGLALYGDYLYATEHYNLKLLVIDVSDPTDPQTVGAVEDVWLGCIPIATEDIVYCADGRWTGYRLFNVTNKTNPFEIDLLRVCHTGDDVQLIELFIPPDDENRILLAVADDDGGFRIFEPFEKSGGFRLIGGYGMGDSITEDTPIEITSFVHHPIYSSIYLSVDRRSDLLIVLNVSRNYDVQDYTDFQYEVTLLASLFLLEDPTDVVISEDGNTAFVSTRNCEEDEMVFMCVIHVIDMTDILNPVNVSTFKSNGDSGVQMAVGPGDYLYCVAGFDGIIVWDVTDKYAPIQAAVFDSNKAQMIVIDKEREIAILSDDSDGVKIIDISDPYNPTLLSSVDTEDADNIYLTEDSHFVVVSDDDFVRIIDILDVYNPVALDWSIEMYSPDSVVMKDNYLYVADGKRGLKAYRLDLKLVGHPVQFSRFCGKTTVTINATDHNGTISQSFELSKRDYCNGHGWCTLENDIEVCECRDEYEGDYCEMFRCTGLEYTDPGSCNGRGNCTAPSTCECFHKEYYDSYQQVFGEDCDLFLGNQLVLATYEVLVAYFSISQDFLEENYEGIEFNNPFECTRLFSLDTNHQDYFEELEELISQNCTISNLDELTTTRGEAHFLKISISHIPHQTFSHIHESISGKKIGFFILFGESEEVHEMEIHPTYQLLHKEGQVFTMKTFSEPEVGSLSDSFEEIDGVNSKKPQDMTEVCKKKLHLGNEDKCIQLFECVRSGSGPASDEYFTHYKIGFIPSRTDSAFHYAKFYYPNDQCEVNDWGFETYKSFSSVSCFGSGEYGDYNIMYEMCSEDFSDILSFLLSNQVATYFVYSTSPLSLLIVLLFLFACYCCFNFLLFNSRNILQCFHLWPYDILRKKKEEEEEEQIVQQKDLENDTDSDELEDVEYMEYEKHDENHMILSEKEEIFSDKFEDENYIMKKERNVLDFVHAQNVDGIKKSEDIEGKEENEIEGEGNLIDCEEEKEEEGGEQNSDDTSNYSSTSEEDEDEEDNIMEENENILNSKGLDTLNMGQGTTLYDPKKKKNEWILKQFLCCCCCNIFPTIIRVLKCGLMVLVILAKEGIALWFASSEFLDDSGIDTTNKHTILLTAVVDMNRNVIWVSIGVYVILNFLMMVFYIGRFHLDPIMFCIAHGALKEFVYYRIFKAFCLLWFMCINLFSYIIKYSYLDPYEKESELSSSDFYFSIILPECLLLFSLVSVLSYNGVSSHSHVKRLTKLGWCKTVLCCSNYFPRVSVGWAKCGVDCDVVLEDFFQLLFLVDLKEFEHEKREEIENIKDHKKKDEQEKITEEEEEEDDQQKMMKMMKRRMEALEIMEESLKEEKRRWIDRLSESEEYGHLSWELLRGLKYDEIVWLKEFFFPVKFDEETYSTVFHNHKIFSKKWIFSVVLFPVLCFFGCSGVVG